MCQTDTNCLLRPYRLCGSENCRDWGGEGRKKYRVHISIKCRKYSTHPSSGSEPCQGWTLANKQEFLHSFCLIPITRFFLDFSSWQIVTCKSNKLLSSPQLQCHRILRRTVWCFELVTSRLLGMMMFSVHWLGLEEELKTPETSSRLRGIVTS